jgi:hypothetical protein
MVASLIVGGSIFATQIIKQRSIERQLDIKIQEERRQEEIKLKKEEEERREEKEAQEAKMSLEELKLKQQECESYLTGLMKKWDNIIGIKYEPYIYSTGGKCEVTYIDSKTGEMNTSPLEWLRDN